MAVWLSAEAVPIRGLRIRSSDLGGPFKGWLVVSKRLGPLPRRRGAGGGEAPWAAAVAGRAVGCCRWRGRSLCQPARGYSRMSQHSQAATLCIPGCNPMYPRLQPYVSRVNRLEGTRPPRCRPAYRGRIEGSTGSRPTAGAATCGPPHCAGAARC